ncbi:MAG: TIM barrel protein [Candidatus Latescibacteria bacterium]|nr:TIM barrel protein [Candidatus Latescibacterota bacterium]
MDISFMTNAGGSGWSLDECAAWAQAHDFDCVRLGDSGALDSDHILAGGAVQVSQTLADHDLYLACLTSHCNLLDDDQSQAQAESQRLIKAIKSARALDCPVVLTGSGAPVRNGQFYGMFSSPPGNPSDRCDELVDRFAAMFTPVMEVAKEYDVKIALDVAVRMGNIGCNPEMWEKLLDAVPSDHLGLSCDPSHWLWMGIMPAEDVIRDYAGKWYYADVKDCEISPRMLYRQGIIGNWWWQYRVPGRGQLDWALLIGALVESGYNYVLCVENEDRGLPGLGGFAYGCRHLRQFLPAPGEETSPPDRLWQTSSYQRRRPE